MAESIDLGYGVSMRYYGWHPERDLNPQYEGIPDLDRAGIIISHVHPDGSLCEGGVTFDYEPFRSQKPVWTVVQEEPLTISPSVHNTACGLHGHIQDGKWVPV